jgi:hypothetical protein
MILLQRRESSRQIINHPKKKEKKRRYVPEPRGKLAGRAERQPNERAKKIPPKNSPSKPKSWEKNVISTGISKIHQGK